MSHFTPQKTTSPQRTSTTIDVESLYTSAPVGLCLLGTDTQYLRVNQQIADIDGYSIEHHIGKKVRDLVPDLAHTIEKLTQKVVATGEPVLNIDIEGETPTRPGVTRYWKTSLWPVKNDTGQVSAINVVAEEITEHKRTEEPLRAAIAYNRGLIEASLDPLVTISSDGKISDVNEATVLATGVSREDLIGTDFSSYFTHPEKAKAGYEKVYRDGAVTDYELEIRHKNGRTIPVLYNATVYRDGSGAVAGVFAAARDITKWKKAEVERSRLAAIVDDSDDAIIGKSLDGMIVSWNNGAERLYGYTAAEAIGRHISFLLLPDQVDDIDELFDKIKSGHSIFHYETGRMRKDGTTVQVSLSLSPIRDREGVLIGASTIARDITQRKKAEEVMRRVSAYNRSLIEASLDPLVTINSKGKISDVNNATVRVTGVPRGDLIGTDFSNYFTEQDRAKAGYEQAFLNGSVTDYELQLRHQNGSITPVLYNATVFRDELGNLAGVFAAARDITERKRAEEALRASTAYNRSLIEASLDPFVTIHPNGTITDVNAATARVTGYDRDALIGTDFSNYFTEPEKAKAGYEMVFREGSVVDYELRVRHRDGHVTPVLYNASLFRDESDNFIEVFAAARDITKQKHAEDALRAANAYNRGLIEASVDPFVTISAEGTINDVNEATVHVTGVSREELIGTDFSRYFTEPDHAKAGYERVFRDGSITNYELGLRHRNGQVTPVLYNATIFRDESSAIAGVFAAARDVTEQKRIEDALMKAYTKLDDRVKERTAELAQMNVHLQNEITERMRAEESLKKYAEHLKRSNEDLERFAFISSHDLQEPLRTMVTFTQLLERRYKGRFDPDADEYIQYIVTAGQRMQLLIQDLLEFSRVNTRGGDLRPTNAATIVDHALSSLHFKIKESGAVITNDSLPMVIADPSQIQEVFQNLISNAIKFKKPDEPPIVHISAKAEDGMVQFSVKDNGIGIESQYFEKIFVIFQRLHGREQFPGTGIGLALVKRIVERHGGKIWVESEPRVGSTFHFTVRSVGRD